jgi:hypothetical protein
MESMIIIIISGLSDDSIFAVVQFDANRNVCRRKFTTKKKKSEYLKCHHKRTNRKRKKQNRFAAHVRPIFSNFILFYLIGFFPRVMN